MKSSTRNALALFIFGLVMVSISPIFSVLIRYEAFVSILLLFSNFFSVEELRWGTISIGFVAALLGLLTFLFNWKKK